MIERSRPEKFDRHDCPRPFHLAQMKPMVTLWVMTVIDKCGQATKGVRWMSWHREATKDVEACDKSGEAGKQALIPEFLNEETRLEQSSHLALNV